MSGYKVKDGIKEKAMSYDMIANILPIFDFSTFGFYLKGYFYGSDATHYDFSIDYNFSVDRFSTDNAAIVDG